jgi:RNA polymerase-associated protein CTR9
VSSKSRIDDVVDVLLYISFAYFDWARHTELHNDSKAAPADGRYKKAMEHLELAISKESKKQVILQYNLCMTKLQAANCVLQKLTRNIPRTVEEVEEALAGLQDSLTIVQDILKQKEEKKKVQIPTSTLQNFLNHCRANITSAESHLEDEKKRRSEVEAEREIRRMEAEAASKEAEIVQAIQKADELKNQELRDKKADEKMQKVEKLRENWDHEKQAQQAEKEKKGKQKRNTGIAAGAEDFLVDDTQGDTGGGHGLFDDSSDEEEEKDKEDGGNGNDNDKKETAEKKPSQGDLFGDSDDDSEKELEDEAPKKTEAKPSTQDLFGDSDDDDDDNGDATPAEKKVETKPPADKDLFGESSSDEEIAKPGEKHDIEDSDGDKKEAAPRKKQRVLEDDDDDED